MGSIVENTSEKVSEGQEVTNEAIEIFENITRNINSITDQIQMIEKASKEQGEGIKQTSTAINQLDQSATGNKEVAHSTGNHADNLKDLGEELENASNTLHILINGIKSANNNLNVC